MKKILILIITLISITSTSNASFGSVSSLDLYKNIDEGINDLQDKMTDFELEGGNDSKGILNGINKLAKNTQTIECLDESKKISTTKFKKIVENNQINEIINLFNENCQKDKSTSIGLANKYYDLFQIYYETSINTANNKSEKIYKISQIGIYSDGNLDNSGFDLITDIEEIDKIIFADVIDYEGEQIDSIDDVLNDFFEPLNDKINELIKPKPLIKNKENNKIPIEYTPPNINKPKENIVNTVNTYSCPPLNNNNGLSSDTIDGLINNIENNINQNNDNVLNNSNNNNNLSNNSNKDTDTLNKKNPNGDYQKVTDNSQWPCETFFCIMIDFTTYEHSLFGGGENITIEYLLNRSNKHLSKAASTSLIPAKMGTNNFELGLKDLNLPDVFHLSFQVSTKPIPILNIEKQGKQEQDELSAKSLLEEYYKINGLDYKRRNDLDAIDKLEANKQNVNNASGLSIEELLKKQAENDTIVKERQKKANVIRKTIDQKVSYGVMGTFEEQFTELDKFTLGINDYVSNLDSLIKELRKIPIEY